MRELLDRVRWTESGCWEWTGAHTKAGYAAIRDGYLHRLSYEHFIGPIPDGLEIDHLCRNRGCCNPLHLEAVTHAENMRRGFWGAKTHCPKGHPYEGDNLIGGGKAGRLCRECKAQRRNKTERRISATHCPNGHEWTPETTGQVRTPSGSARRCVICRRETVRRYKEKVRNGAH